MLKHAHMCMHAHTPAARPSSQRPQPGGPALVCWPWTAGPATCLPLPRGCGAAHSTRAAAPRVPAPLPGWLRTEVQRRGSICQSQGSGASALASAGLKQRVHAYRCVPACTRLRRVRVNLACVAELAGAQSMASALPCQARVCAVHQTLHA